jgi:hypothetical protein
MHDVRFLWQLKLTKSSHQPITALMMGTEMVPEMSMTCNQLTWLTGLEDFVTTKICLKSKFLLNPQHYVAPFSL